MKRSLILCETCNLNSKQKRKSCYCLLNMLYLLFLFFHQVKQQKRKRPFKKNRKFFPFIINRHFHSGQEFRQIPLSLRTGNGTPFQYSCQKIPWAEEPGRLQSMGSQSRTQLSDFTFPFHFHALEKEMATHSSVLAWRIPGRGEPGGLLSMESHRVRRNLAAAAAASLPISLSCGL